MGTQSDERGAGTSTLGRGVGIAGNEGVPSEQRSYDLALDADSPAVDQPHFGESFGMSGLQVVADDQGHLARREGVEVQGILDRDADGLAVYSRGPPSTCSVQ